jgi:hypothetical protein
MQQQSHDDTTKNTTIHNSYNNSNNIANTKIEDDDDDDNNHNTTTGSINTTTLTSLRDITHGKEEEEIRNNNRIMTTTSEPQEILVEEINNNNNTPSIVPTIIDSFTIDEGITDATTTTTTSDTSHSVQLNVPITENETLTTTNPTTADSTRSTDDNNTVMDVNGDHEDVVVSVSTPMEQNDAINHATGIQPQPTTSITTSTITTPSLMMVVEADEDTSSNSISTTNPIDLMTTNTSTNTSIPNNNDQQTTDLITPSVEHYEPIVLKEQQRMDDSNHSNVPNNISSIDNTSTTTTTTTTTGEPEIQNIQQQHQEQEQQPDVVRDCKDNDDECAVVHDVVDDDHHRDSNDYITGNIEPQQQSVTISEFVNDNQESIPNNDDNINETNNSYCSSSNSTAPMYPLTPSPQLSSKTKQIHETNHIQEQKLLLLISTNSIDRQVKVRQDLVITALNANNIDYECIDGSIQSTNSTNTTTGSNTEQQKKNENDNIIALRNELFALSGLRGVYPQFFIVHLQDGGTTKFWGTFDDFQMINDSGQLQSVFGNNIKYDNDDSIISTPEGHTNIAKKLYTSSIESPDKSALTTNKVIPDEIYEKFSQQNQRIEENYQIERQESEQRHQHELQQQQILYQQCEQSKRQLEERLLNELKQKDEQIQDVHRRNEGYRLKMDVLKREVTGTQEVLQARDQEIQKLNQKFLNDLRAMEKQYNLAEKNATKYQEEVHALQIKVESIENEKNISHQEYETMKDRAKSIALELKDRRSECHHLQGKEDELLQQNNNLKSTVNMLEEKLNHQGMDQTDKDKEIEQLRAKLNTKDRELMNIEKEWQDKLTKSEQVLNDYKKRAQHALSMSNSRTAAAIQAREEAEFDARAARSTADAAYERTMKAEIESREAMAKAKITVEIVEKERDNVLQKLEQLKVELSKCESERNKKDQELESMFESIKNKELELVHLRESRNEADMKIASLQQRLMESSNIIDTLREEIYVLRADLQQATATAVTERAVFNADSPSDISKNGSYDNVNDDTITALRLELREANDAIEDLKIALKNAIEMNEQQQQQQQLANTSENATTSNYLDQSNTETDTTTAIPLFYAMEKQAELKTARTEMNRLASLLADVQSEKMEAYEAMEIMQRKLEDAEARLKRNEKLGIVPNNNQNALSDEDNHHATMTSNNASATNIEYLKHILLRYMNAKSNVERKTLVPVIGAVLELTPNEVQTVIQNLEQQRSIGTIMGANGGNSNLFSFLS